MRYYGTQKLNHNTTSSNNNSACNSINNKPHNPASSSEGCGQLTSNEELHATKNSTIEQNDDTLNLLNPSTGRPFPTPPPVNSHKDSIVSQDWGEPPAVIEPILTRLLPPWRSPEASWRIEDPNDPVSLASKSVNSLNVFLAFLTQPQWADHVDDHTSRISARTGMSAWKAEQYAQVGLVLQRFPRLSAIAMDGLLNFQLVQRMCEHLAIVDPSNDELFDHAIVRLLQPTVPKQAMRTTKWVDETLNQLIDFLDPLSKPIPENSHSDKDGRAITSAHGEEDTQAGIEDQGDTNCCHGAVDRIQEVLDFSYDTRSPDSTTFTLTVSALTGIELLKAIKNAASAKSITQGEALLGLIQGNVTANVTLNLYKNTHGLPLDEVFGEGHWLSTAASKTWLDRVTHLAGAGASSNNGYRPSEQTAAMVAGRDGHCRFPGCQVPAYRCQIDHVHRYDHENPEASGPTSTENLHLLCPKHHRLKTAGSWDVTLHPDASETWTSHGDGHCVITTAEGPLGRQTFQHKAVRRIRITRTFNQERLEAIDEEREEQARREREGEDIPPF
ncbi:hypothetical protein CRES_0975 [Corynebacterium resistens DSM 45100]|uniref:HNH nuclease domain-containing protein n=1 Tax=Corynebacterium resistens (strain DSM 45100 / JCM 12819 / GTC 2026 / SICGH 158) TaxID=662755 RepID=F8E1R4_CORRG|nr:HNH endonuclease signature motif containing protein [Corynebacterium resistens]AEI09331.1 hypothetical protein CRES_0975 [Corynebacterium resistens DSM 45100]